MSKAIPLPLGHAHWAALVNHDSYSISQRIDHFSFGELVPGIIKPLDESEKKMAIGDNQMLKCFIAAVPRKPTNIQDFSRHPSVLCDRKGASMLQVTMESLEHTLNAISVLSASSSLPGFADSVQQ